MKLLMCVFAIFASPTVLAPLRTAPAAQEPQDSSSPAQIAFDRVCKVCHGPEGRGDSAPRLVPFDRDYQEVLAIVRDGRGEMPPISERRVSDDEVKQIVEYLHSLSKPPVVRKESIQAGMRSVTQSGHM